MREKSKTQFDVPQYTSGKVAFVGIKVLYPYTRLQYKEATI